MYYQYVEDFIKPFYRSLITAFKTTCFSPALFFAGYLLLYCNWLG